MTRPYILVPLFLVAALGAGGIGAGPGIHRTPSADTLNIRECPEAHALDSTDVEYLLTSGTAGIPEYNDCQRFIVDGKFDALYAIYATHPKTINLGPKVAVLVGVIRSFGGAYPTLGIKPGLNCVYLSGDRRLAKVVDSATFKGCCPIVELSRLPAPFLESRPTVADSFFRDSDYPQVARWDWDSRHKLQYMGFKCAAAWCQIGAPGFQASPAWTPLSTLPARMRRNMMIKGWYDEQTLAGTAPTPGAIPPVSGIRGTIFPESSLADYTDASFQGTWQPIAYVAMADASDKYLQVMGFGATPYSPATPLDPKKLNRIDLCAGPASACSGVPNPAPTCPATATSGAVQWGWARITRPGGATKYKCVTRWSNAGMAISSGGPVYLPAASRWRWVLADETGWFRCSAGCCEVH